MACEKSLRVAQRFQYAQDHAQELEWLDQVADTFLDLLAKSTNFQEKDVAEAFEQNGIEADDVNKLAPDGGKEAGIGQVVKILGGLIGKGLWYVLVNPFLNLGKLFRSPQFRMEVKASFRKAVSHEIRATKHMISVAKRMAAGEEVNSFEKKAALRQAVDLLGKAVFIYLATPQVAGLFQGTVWKAFSALLAPVDEILLVLLDKPLRAVGKKLLSVEGS